MDTDDTRRRNNNTDLAEDSKVSQARSHRFRESKSRRRLPTTDNRSLTDSYHIRNEPERGSLGPLLRKSAYVRPSRHYDDHFREGDLRFVGTRDRSPFGGRVYGAPVPNARNTLLRKSRSFYHRPRVDVGLGVVQARNNIRELSRKKINPVPVASKEI